MVQKMFKQCCVPDVFVRVSVNGLSADTTHTFTVYTEIDDVIKSGVDITVRMLSSAG